VGSLSFYNEVNFNSKQQIMAGHSIFAHSLPDKIWTARLLPLYIRIFLSEYQQKNPLKHYILPLGDLY